ncbi:predicted protein [Nematostella vectensis]|uniref:Dynein light chain roadblock n=1 Tax=Nematostella vectensis TaxID=45351 RepID=A7S9M3_NEMVE|nr:predicted protein [Nematostella vectensis]|eukprot:XP_001631665.1 predicted protein [Nematostella vectensis]
MTTSEVENTLQRISLHPGVMGWLVINNQGEPIKSSMDIPTTQLYASEFAPLAHFAHSAVRDMDPQNELRFIRVRTNKMEFMVAPDNEYLLIVIQKVTSHDKDVISNE